VITLSQTVKTPPSLVLCRPIVGLLPLLLVLAGLVQPSRAVAEETTLVNLTNTVWRFNDSTNDLGTDWRAINYLQETNADWKTGTGLFGIDTTVRPAPLPPVYPAPFVTPLVMGAGHITYYFRTRFLLPQNPASNIVQVTAYVDDGAVFYLNGVEISRVRLPTDPVLYTNRAELANPEGVPVTFVIDPARLVLGTNILAVEVHQQNENSSDVVFGLQMVATGTAAPDILDLTEPANRTISQGQSTTLSVVGSGIPTPTYSWYRNGVLLPMANGPTYTIPSAGEADDGNYYAVLANSLGAATSRVAVVTVNLDVTPPSILYAVGRPNLTDIFLPFTEPLDPLAGPDVFNWFVVAADGSSPRGLALREAYLTDQTNLTLVTIDQRDPMKSYIVSNGFGIPDLFGNELPASTMTPVAIFPVELISGSNSWRFEHSGTDLGADWIVPSFNDSAWSIGPAPLDAFRATAETPAPQCRQDGLLPQTEIPVGTCLNSLSNAANTAQISTAYFRTHFNFSGDAHHTVLNIQALVDDAAVFYLNGEELLRLGLPEGPVSYSTLANRTIPNPLPEILELGSGKLVQGENVLAVEVHQDSLFSADLTLGVTVSALVPSVTVTTAPRLTAGLAGGNITISWTPAVGRLQSALEVAGPWEDVPPANPHTEPATGARKFYRVVVP
jgi:hypothetical protein